MVLCACCASERRVEAKKHYDTSTLTLLRKGTTTFQTSNIQDEGGMLGENKTKADPRHGLREAQRVGDGRKGMAESPPRHVPFGGA